MSGRRRSTGNFARAGAFKQVYAKAANSSGLYKKSAPNAVNGLVGLCTGIFAGGKSTMFTIDLTGDFSRIPLPSLAGKRLDPETLSLFVTAKMDTPSAQHYLQKPENGLASLGAGGAGNGDNAAGSGGGGAAGGAGNAQDGAVPAAAAAVHASDAQVDASAGGKEKKRRVVLPDVAVTLRQRDTISVSVYSEDKNVQERLKKISCPGEVKIEGLTVRVDDNCPTQFYFNASNVVATNRFSPGDVFWLLENEPRKSFFQQIKTERLTIEEIRDKYKMGPTDPWPKEVLKGIKQDPKRNLEEQIVIKELERSLTDEERQVLSAKLKLTAPSDDEMRLLNPEDGSRGYEQGVPVFEKKLIDSFVKLNIQQGQETTKTPLLKTHFSVLQWDEARGVPKKEAQMIMVGLKIWNDLALKLLGTYNVDDWEAVAPHVFSNADIPFPLIVDTFLDISGSLDNLGTQEIEEISFVLEYVCKAVYCCLPKYVMENGLPITWEYAVEHLERKYGGIDFTDGDMSKSCFNLSYNDDAKQFTDKNTLHKETKGAFFNLAEYPDSIDMKMMRDNYKLYAVPGFPMSVETLEYLDTLNTPMEADSNDGNSDSAEAKKRARVHSKAIHDAKANLVVRALCDERDPETQKLGLRMPRDLESMRMLIYAVRISSEDQLLQPSEELKRMFEDNKRRAELKKQQEEELKQKQQQADAVAAAAETSVTPKTSDASADGSESAAPASAATASAAVSEEDQQMQERKPAPEKTVRIVTPAEQEAAAATAAVANDQQQHQDEDVEMQETPGAASATTVTATAAAADEEDDEDDVSEQQKERHHHHSKRKHEHKRKHRGERSLSRDSKRRKVVSHKKQQTQEEPNYSDEDSG